MSEPMKPERYAEIEKMVERTDGDLGLMLDDCLAEIDRLRVLRLQDRETIRACDERMDRDAETINGLCTERDRLAGIVDEFNKYLDYQAVRRIAGCDLVAVAWDRIIREAAEAAKEKKP